MPSAPRTVLLAVSLAAAPAARLAAQCPDGTPPPCEVRAQQVIARAAPPSEAERGRSFLVLPFRNITRAEDHNWLIEGSPRLLADVLGQWQEISVVSDGRMYPALRRHGLTPGEVMDEDLVRRVAEETGGWTVIEGDVLATGNRIRVTARAYDVVTNRVLVRARDEVDADEDVRLLYERLAGQLLRTAGLEASTLDLPGVTTQSLDAYKAYVRGLTHLNRGEHLSAQNEFQQAVTLDSTFAQAYAKLAEASMTSFEAFLNPASPVYRYAERAAALSDRLPPRDREFIQAANALLHGQIATARDALEQLIAADSNDIEALAALAGIESLLDPIIITVDGVERPRRSFNEAARLAKRVLSLNPTLHGNYALLVYTYALAAGYLNGQLPVFRREAPSLPALFMQGPDAFFVLLLTDSLEQFPIDSVAGMTRDSVDAARERARAVALQWVGRWVAAAPTEALAHFMASVVYDLDGQLDAALAELHKADSLGLEFELVGNVPGQRMVLLSKQRRFAEARAIADSLLGDGSFNLSLFASPYVGWGFHLYLLTGAADRADAIVARLQTILGMVGLPPDEAAATAVCLVVCPPTRPAVFANIPDTLRLEALDSLFAQLEDVPEDGPIANNLFRLVGEAFSPASSAFRSRLAASARQAASRLTESGRTDFAVALASAAVNLDTTQAGYLAVLETLTGILEADPDNLGAHYQIGKIGALAGRHLEVAEAALKRYLEQEAPAGAPSHAAAYWRLGMIYEHQGKTVDARAAYEAALRLAPEFEAAKTALEKLGKP
ncbi:MAG: tetratricopeptide repeat protein [Gemmatimonadetes bacterium]|nr:tetratricopeptide repeat protein [Gemmatimonadota bacterium]